MLGGAKASMTSRIDSARPRSDAAFTATRVDEISFAKG
jgi:hypothetical protein